LGDPQIHHGEVVHDLARMFQVFLVADEGPCAGVLENVLKLSYPVEKIYWENHSSDLGQRIVNDSPVYRVGHHQYTDISWVESCTNESMGQTIHLPV
jgi:hypothetical protein